MKKAVLLGSLLFLLCPQTFAQGKGGLLPWLKKAGTAGTEKSVTQAAERAARMALLQSRARMASLPAYRVHNLPKKLPHALVQVISSAAGELLSSGFIMEEFETGRRVLWAVVPYHVSGGQGDPVRLRVMDRAGRVRIYPLEVTVNGGWGRNAIDAALVKLPEELYDQVFALRLSHFDAEPGEELLSCGYMLAAPRVGAPLSAPRRVTDATGFRITGDYRLPQDPSGYCGSPVLNQGGYVMGVHCASAPLEATFAVSAAGIRQLLRAYYFGEAELPVKFLGREVFRVKSSQSIGAMTLTRRGRVLENIALASFEGRFAYDKTDLVFKELEILPRDVISFHVVERGRVAHVIEYTIPEKR